LLVLLVVYFLYFRQVSFTPIPRNFPWKHKLFLSYMVVEYHYFKHDINKNCRLTLSYILRNRMISRMVSEWFQPFTFSEIDSTSIASTLNTSAFLVVKLSQQLCHENLAQRQYFFGVSEIFSTIFVQFKQILDI